MDLGSDTMKPLERLLSRVISGQNHKWSRIGQGSDGLMAITRNLAAILQNHCNIETPSLTDCRTGRGFFGWISFKDSENTVSLSSGFKLSLSNCTPEFDHKIFFFPFGVLVHLQAEVPYPHQAMESTTSKNILAKSLPLVTLPFTQDLYLYWSAVSVLL